MSVHAGCRLAAAAAAAAAHRCPLLPLPPQDMAGGLSPPQMLLWLGLAVLAQVQVAWFGVASRWLQVCSVVKSGCR